MATKKLTIEVDAKTDKAKRKIDALGDTGSVSGASAPDNLSKALDKAAKAADRFDGDIGKASSSMTKMVRGFAGMGVGLAASYAAGHMQQGAARNAVEYGASAIQGASAGFMMGGPLGAVAGGAIGLAKTYLDKDAEQSAYTKAFDEAEQRYSSAKAWREKFSSLTSPDGKTSAEQIAALKSELEKYREAETKIKDSVSAFAEKGEYDNADHQRESLAENRSRQNQLEAAINALEKTIEKDIPHRTGGAADALTRIGGMGAGGTVEDMSRLASEQLDVLKRIEQKTGAQPWQ